MCSLCHEIHSLVETNYNLHVKIPALHNIKTLIYCFFSKTVKMNHAKTASCLFIFIF